MKMRTVAALIAVGLLAGCAAIVENLDEFTPVDPNAPKEFTYDFSVPGKSQADLWRSARDYFAGEYGGSVFRVLDEKDGTRIGRGFAPWTMAASRCLTEYQIKFASQDGKARLEYQLIAGVPARSQCSGWPRPSKRGYRQIIDSFTNSAKGLELALKGRS